MSRTSRRLLIAGLTTLLGFASCSEPTGDTSSQTSESAASTGASEDEINSAFWKRPPDVAPRSLPPGTVTPDARRVLFLPALNRTRYRLHAYLLRGFDRTLAAHAALHLDRPVVDPALVWEIARQAGMPEALTPGTADSPSPELLDRVARQTGAGVVVWAEITGSGSVRLHAITALPDADATLWDGVEAALLRPAEVGLYDGPRAVTAAVHARRAGESPSQAALPSGGEGAIDGVMAAAWSGSAAAARRSELALADLAVAHPTWSRPLVELAVLRMTRAFVFEREQPQGWLAEGALVSRHLALLATAVDARDQARLQALDSVALAQITPANARLAVSQGLPVDDLLRAVLASADRDRSREVFGLDAVKPGGPAAAWFVEAERVRGGDFAAAVQNAVRDIGIEEIFGNDALLDAVYTSTHADGNWAGMRAATLARVPGGVARTIASAQGRCASAPDAARGRCIAALHAFFAHDIPELAPAALHDPAAEDETLLSWAARFMDPRSEHPNRQLPELAVFETDPAFAATWDADRRLAAALDEALRTAEHARGVTAVPRDLLVADPRREIERGRARIVDALFEPAWVGSRRGDRDTIERYSVALRRRDLGVPLARYYHLKLQSALRATDFYRSQYSRLVSIEPWHTYWVKPWIDSWGVEGQPPQATARFLESILPRPRHGTEMVARAWHHAGDPKRAREILEVALEQTPDAGQAKLLDDVLVDLDAPLSERVKKLEAVAIALPTANAIKAQLASAAMGAGDYDRAEQLFGELLEFDRWQQSSCEGLILSAAGRGDPARAIEAAESCAKGAPHKWASSRELTWLGNLRMHAGELERAEAAFRAAYREVGGAAWVVYGLGFVEELQGRSEEADAHYAFLEETYDQADATWRRAALQIRNGEIDAARNRLLERAREGGLSETALYVLGRIELRTGRLDRFLQAIASKPSSETARATARLRARDLDDLEGALAVLDDHLATKPDDVRARRVRADLLIEGGRPGDAITEAERALRKGYDADLTVLRIRALAESGRIDEARAALESYAARWTASTHVQRARFHVLRAEGRPEAARQALRTVWDRRTRRKPIDSWWIEASSWVRDELRLGISGSSRNELVWLRDQAEAIATHIPWSADAWSTLATIHRALDETDAASAALRTAAELGARPGAAERLTAAGQTGG